MYDRMFMYTVYAMDYSQAMMYVDVLHKMSRTNLRYIATTYGMHLHSLEGAIKKILRHSPKSFQESRKELFEQYTYTVNSDSDRRILNQGIYMVLSIFPKSISQIKIGKTTYRFNFEESSILLTKGFSESDTTVNLYNASVHISDGETSFELGIPEAISIYTRDRFTLNDLVERIRKGICDHVRSTAYEHVTRHSKANAIDFIRMFNLVNPTEDLMNGWRSALRIMSKGAWEQPLSLSDARQIDQFAKHPQIEVYEDTEGMVFYLNSEGIDRAYLVVEKVKDTYLIVNNAGPVYERWKLANRLEA